MPTLSKELRRTLENVVADARRIAEAGAEQALKQLAVHNSESWPATTSKDKAIREKLRAHGRQLGDQREQNRTQEIRRLKQACAYEHWHRMLFARFLAENNLLVHPEYGEPVSLDEVKEIAREENADWLSIAASFAQQMLLEVFRPDDPVLELNLPPETRQKLEEKMATLPTEVFTAEDSLGWVYQFWQRDEKDAVNQSEVKIGADELAPVTQLFTEDYMVLFLLHNTLGAWWTARRRAEGRETTLPGYDWTYLRLAEDGMPAAGSYDGWPKVARELRILDPCMGSGHFLTFALPVLALMRIEEEGLSLPDAVAAVLSDNLFGLELDARCSQIAAFNLALTAWKLIGSYCKLPPPALACTGLAINAREEDWVKLAGSDGRKQDLMRWLFSLFKNAPTFGSLIDPRRVGKPMVENELAELLPLLEQALAEEESSEETRELAIAARGLLSAVRILASQFTIVMTNVPYLERGAQNEDLKAFSSIFYEDSKADLGSAMADRCLRLCRRGGTVALVLKHEPLFQPRYRLFRERLLRSYRWGTLARLGPRAFETISGEIVNVVLLILDNRIPEATGKFSTLDVASMRSPADKAASLRSQAVQHFLQKQQLDNPSARVVFENDRSKVLVNDYATYHNGIQTGDYPRFGRVFWELPEINNGWALQQSTVRATCLFGGLEHVLLWESGKGDLLRFVAERLGDAQVGSWLRGKEAWGRRGIAVSAMGDLNVSIYSGELFDDNTVVLIPNDPSVLPALWEFCASEEYYKEVRKIAQNLKVRGPLVEVPFDLTYWTDLATEKYPVGLPGPTSDSPTQWVFNGHPLQSTHPLQVAVGRLVGYRWPLQTGSTFLDSNPIPPDGLSSCSDSDGIVCLSSLAGEPAAADRLRALLPAAYGPDWSAAKLADLLEGWNSLEVWLRDGFFEEHCDLFHDRPFVWHIWDGRKDGFHALVNYHKLAAPKGEGMKTLEKLIYTALGDWIARQKTEVASSIDGADARLAAAQHLQSELEKIMIGEAPYDIFVRWKPICEQPIGWEPDLNDGVRLNIRPWLTAALAPHTKPKKGSCILRTTPRITYGKDRGKEPLRNGIDFPWFAEATDRNNDIHLGLAEKRTARERRKK